MDLESATEPAQQFSATEAATRQCPDLTALKLVAKQLRGTG